jgi:hypothetical protein
MEKALVAELNKTPNFYNVFKNLHQKIEEQNFFLDEQNVSWLSFVDNERVVCDHSYVFIYYCCYYYCCCCRRRRLGQYWMIDLIFFSELEGDVKRKAFYTLSRDLTSDQDFPLLCNFRQQS